MDGSNRGRCWRRRGGAAARREFRPCGSSDGPCVPRLSSRRSRGAIPSGGGYSTAPPATAATALGIRPGEGGGRRRARSGLSDGWRESASRAARSSVVNGGSSCPEDAGTLFCSAAYPSLEAVAARGLCRAFGEALAAVHAARIVWWPGPPMEQHPISMDGAGA
eukprot:3776863-Prymnesium_polylepis.1